MGSPTERIDIISAYFVPTRAGGVAQLLNLVRKGVKIAILTNSSGGQRCGRSRGYARWRKKLLRYGVELYELKPTREHETAVHDRGLPGTR